MTTARARRIDTVFLDAGGVLVHPNWTRVAAALVRHGVVADAATLTAAEPHATLEMDRGVLGTICLGRIGATSHPDLGEIKINVLGTDGALAVGESRPEVAIYYRGQPDKEFRHRRVGVENDYLLLEDFANAIDTNGETMLDARAGRAICAVVQAALESARSNTPVEVPQ